MLLANINVPSTYQPFLNHPVWHKALQWIKDEADTSPTGIYELQGRDMYVNVHGYDTLPADECRFESHQRYIDLQYCIDGGEKILWCPIGELQQDGDYDPHKDFQFHRPAAGSSCLNFRKGVFGIFLSEDGHCPKIADGIHRSVHKLVVKINMDLFEGAENSFAKK